jgi:hypothetical protein
VSYTISECSPQAKTKITSYEDPIGVARNFHKLAKYPVGELAIGQSFTCPLEEGNEQSLRALATEHSKKLKKKFVVVKHSGLKLVEFARVG